MTLLEMTNVLGITGWLREEEGEKLNELAANRDCLEVGSYCGLSAYCMAIVAKTLMCVDTFKAGGDGQQQLNGEGTLPVFCRNVSRFANVKWLALPSLEAAQLLTGMYDFIFIDAMHDRDSVAADIEAWWPKLRPGGVMAFHDYADQTWAGVKEAVDARFGSVDGWVGNLAWVAKKDTSRDNWQ